MKKNKEQQIDMEVYKKKFKYRFPKTSKSIATILMIINFFYFLMEFRFGVFDVILDTLSSNGYRFQSVLISYGLILVLLLTNVIILEIFLPESENKIKRDLEIKEIRIKYKIKHEIERHKKHLKEIKKDE